MLFQEELNQRTETEVEQPSERASVEVSFYLFGFFLFFSNFNESDCFLMDPFNVSYSFSTFWLQSVCTHQPVSPSLSPEDVGL